MPRPRLFRSNSLAYHVTVRSNNREWFYISQEECWSILVESLNQATERYGAQAHQLVLMSNHFHLLLSTPDSNIDLVMQYFETQATRQIQYRTERINHVFGGRYKWNVLPDACALAYVFKYICRNPVRAGIVAKCEDFPFSAINDLSCGLVVSEGFDEYWRAIPKPPEERREWLNVPAPSEVENLIRRGLRHPTFKIPAGNDYKRLRNLLTEVYAIAER
jgi:putative transposase